MSSISLPPLTQVCSPCSPKKVPQTLRFSITNIAGGALLRTANPTDVLNCCESASGGYQKFLQTATSGILYPRNGTACEWVSDCYLIDNKAPSNAAPNAFCDPNDTSKGRVGTCITYPSTPLFVSQQNYFYYRFSYFTSWNFTMIYVQSKADGSLGDCPSISARTSGLAAASKFNEIVSCKSR